MNKTCHRARVHDTHPRNVMPVKHIVLFVTENWYQIAWQTCWKPLVNGAHFIGIGHVASVSPTCLNCLNMNNSNNNNDIYKQRSLEKHVKFLDVKRRFWHLHVCVVITTTSNKAHCWLHVLCHHLLVGQQRALQCRAVMLLLVLLLLNFCVTSQFSVVTSGQATSTKAVWDDLPVLTSRCRWDDLSVLTSCCRWDDLSVLTSCCRWDDLPVLTSRCRWDDLPVLSSCCRWDDLPVLTSCCNADCWCC